MKISVIQLCSEIKPDNNLKKIRAFLKEAKEEGSEIAFLPECFYSLSNGKEASPYLLEKGNEHERAVFSLAKESGLYLLGGSAATLVEGKIMNRAYNIAATGKLMSFYDKIHLFSCDLSRTKKGQVINESDIYHSGSNSCMQNIGQMNLGLAICFDLRFPEMFREYAISGANCISVASAFTVPTGKAHWHTLLRARAIENQCFIIASAQWGQNNERIRTYGYSMVVNPWGDVLADAKEGEKVIHAELNFEFQKEVRSRLDVLHH